ncbi:MAG: chemotaxis-specific protein-glutamate methyltransferase CheB [Myxococcales bacterium]|nr:chemotaxis-specific protein-glutamate methyltransferase CheB [Myxococcales bacterium]
MLRVLVIDDCSTMRSIYRRWLDQEGDLTVVGEADCAESALAKVESLDPDVITLDIEMSRMDGIELLEELHARKPVPAVILSSAIAPESENERRAIAASACAVASKEPVDTLHERFVAAIRYAGTRPRRRVPRRTEGWESPTPRGAILIGASTGGTRAVEAILRAVQPSMPPIVVVQHMPARFTAALARRLDEVCALQVLEATQGLLLRAGTATIAPGDAHLRLRPGSGGLSVRLDRSEPIRHYRPSIDVTFESAAEAIGADALGVILTGMGDDGARGLKAMCRSGAMTIAESEETAVVFGMPAAAIAQSAARRVAPLGDIPKALVRWRSEPSRETL